MPDAGGVGFGFQHSPKSARPRRARACSRRKKEAGEELLPAVRKLQNLCKPV